MSHPNGNKTEARRTEAEYEKNIVRKKRRQNRGIGWNGKTLREQLAVLEDKTEATGHYAGLSELPLKTADPIRYEQLYSRLRADLVSARETSKKVSATPIVEQEGELCYGLFTPHPF